MYKCFDAGSSPPLHAFHVVVFLYDSTFAQDFLTKKHSRVLTSQIVEDSFGRQKRRKSTHVTRHLKVATAWDVLQERQLVNSIHRYDKPVSISAASCRADYLPSDTFQGPLSASGLDMTGISTYDQKASWYTCKPDCHAVQYLDAKYIAKCADRNMLNSMRSPWMNVLVQARHHIILREVKEDGTRGPPLYACAYVKGHLAFGWPAQACDVPGHPGLQCFTPAGRVDETMVLIAILDICHWEALPYAWRSPAWQFSSFPGARGKWAQHIRAFPLDGGGFRPLLKVASEAAYWNLSADVVKKLAGTFGIEVPEGGSLFSTCKAALVGILQCSEVEAVGYLQVIVHVVLTGVVHS